MGKIVVLVGESASGKTVVEKKLEGLFGLKALISHTSRPPRKGEIEGVHYYFVSNSEIRKMILSGQTVEYTTYEVGNETWYYALSKREFETALNSGVSVVTINPRGIEQLIDNDAYYKNLIILYLRAEEDIRATRYFMREQFTMETFDRWRQRVKQDELDFLDFNNDIVNKIKNNNIKYVEVDNNVNVDYIADFVLNIFNIIKENISDK